MELIKKNEIENSLTQNSEVNTEVEPEQAYNWYSFCLYISASCYYLSGHLNKNEN